METVPVIRMSSKGQVVIPEDVRERLGLRSGAEFVVLETGDQVVLKPIHRPSKAEWDRLMREARRQARAAGMKRSDITQAIADVRAGR